MTPTEYESWKEAVYKEMAVEGWDFCEETKDMLVFIEKVDDGWRNMRLYKELPRG